MENSEVPSPTVSARPIRLVIIASSLNKFKPIANFLMKRGFSTTATADVKKALEMIQQNPPDFVLISWNLKDAVPAKIAELLVTKLKVHCIAFAEEGDTKTASSLASCRLKDIVHAPISGPVLFMRIQKILKTREDVTVTKKTTQKNESTLTINGDTPIRVTSAAESDIHGKKGSWVSKGTNKGKTIWMFKHDAIRKGEDYFYEGDWPPVMSDNGIWSLADGALYKYQEPIAPEKDPQWVPADVEKQIRKQIQEDALKFILETLIDASSVRKPTAPITGKHLGVVEIRSKIIQGYLLMGSPNDKPVSELLLRVFKTNLEKSLRESKSEIWTEYDFVLHEDMTRFDEWMEKHGRFILEGKYKDQKMNVYFMERTEKAHLQNNALVDGKKTLPIEFLRPNEEITFDVFIRLEKNRKHLKYFKKGTIVHPERLAGLFENKIKSVFVNEKDWSLVQSYEASGYLLAEYTRYQDQYPRGSIV